MAFSLRTPMHTRPFIRVAGGRWLDILVLALACYAVAATLLLTLRQLTAWPGPVTAAASLAGCLLLCALGYANRTRMQGLLRLVASRVETLPLGVILLGGLALRLLWNLLFQAQPGSDGATYVRLAQHLAASHSYGTAATRAYWPVGYPAYLSVWFSVLGDSRAALVASNLLLYLIAALGIHRTATSLAGPGAGTVAALLFALWPNLIAMTATPEKELLVTALLPWAFYWLLQVLNGNRVSWRIFAGGLLLGYCVLIQPSFLFMPLLAALLIIGYGSINRRSLAAAALLIAGAVLALSPWTLRNYALFDRFVLVSTNGGDNLYRANNPLATGGYAARGEVDLSDLGEIEQDSKGKNLALGWIRSHPAEFAALAAEKQVRFLGDDATGIYNTFKVGGVPHSQGLYFILKAGSNAWWIAVWIVIAGLAASSLQNRSALLQTARLPVWPWLYLFALHSVFESTGKYHVPALWALCVLFAVYAASANKVPGK